jgi:hypothetical protein
MCAAEAWTAGASGIRVSFVDLCVTDLRMVAEIRATARGAAANSDMVVSFADQR